MSTVNGLMGVCFKICWLFYLKFLQEFNAYKTASDAAFAQYKSTNDARVLAVETLLNRVLSCNKQGFIFDTATSSCVVLPIPGVSSPLLERFSPVQTSVSRSPARLTRATPPVLDR